MVTIDLGSPLAPPANLLDGLPRRLPLTLPELRLAARAAGGAPLPFEVPSQSSLGPSRSFSGPSSPGAAQVVNPLESRLGETRGSAEVAAYAGALKALHDPAGSLERRQLLVDGRLDAGLAGAIGLLATPTVAVELDVVVEGVQVKSWHRQSDHGVATLSTADGIVFEIAWLPAESWGSELGRVAALPSDLPLRPSGVPAAVEVPYELLDAAGEALHSGRGDLVPVLAEQHAGTVLEGGRAVPAAEVAGLLQTLSRETRGRLRALVAHVSDGPPHVVGVLSWVLLSDGWRALESHQVGDATLVRLRATGAEALAGALAPLLAEVSG